jgi:hypothetical protein
MVVKPQKNQVEEYPRRTVKKQNYVRDEVSHNEDDEVLGRENSHDSSDNQEGSNIEDEEDNQEDEEYGSQDEDGDDDSRYTS